MERFWKNKKCIDAVNYINLFSAFYLLAYMPFAFSKPQLCAIIIFCVTYIIDFILSKRWNDFRTDKIKWVFYAFIIYFLLVPVYFLFVDGDNEWARYIIDRRLPFLYVGIFGLFGFNNKFKISYFAYILSGISLTLILYLLFDVGWSNLIHSSEKSMLLANARIENINSHMIFNIFLNTTLVFIFYQLVQPVKKRFVVAEKILLSTAGVIIFCSLILSDGRTGFFTAIFLVLAFIFYLLVKRYGKIVGIIISTVSLGLIFFAYKHHSRMNDEAVKTEPRLVIWQVAKETILEKPLLGHGAAGGKTAFLNNGLKDKERLQYDWLIDDFVTGKAHPHNQFFLAMIEFGIIGLFVLLFIFIYPIIIAPKEKRLYIVLFLFIIAFQSVFESFVIGVPILFFLFILTLLLQRVTPYVNSYD